MKKNNTLKFLEGAVAGVTLGIAATIFLASKRGKKLKRDLGHTMFDFYSYIAPKLKKIKKMGEKEYQLFMEKAVKQYAKAKKVSADVTKELLKETKKSWNYFSKHLGK